MILVGAKKMLNDDALNENHVDEIWQNKLSSSKVPEMTVIFIPQTYFSVLIFI